MSKENKLKFPVKFPIIGSDKVYITSEVDAWHDAVLKEDIGKLYDEYREKIDKSFITNPIGFGEWLRRRWLE